MKKTWSKFEILVTCISVAIIPMAAWLAALLFTGTGTAIASLTALFLVPLICTAALVRFLKLHGKRIWPASVTLIVLLAFLCLAAKYNTELPRMIKQLTGYYNLDATAFFTLFATLICGGALAGTGVGSLLAAKARLKSEAM